MKRGIILAILVLMVLSESEPVYENSSYTKNTNQNQKTHYHYQPFTLKIGSKIETHRMASYSLQSEGGEGKIAYFVDGLPKGARLEGNKIFFGSQVMAGNYVIRVRAIDERGYLAEKIISLIVVEKIIETEEEGKGEENGYQEKKEKQEDQKLQKVINSYSTTTKIETQTYEGNKYPEVKFPTGSNTNSINLVTQQISTTTSPTSPDNRNTITAQDVALRTASERHQNAVKAITNLLAIIDQARANKNYAQAQLQLYVEEYNKAVANQRRAQNTIISIETRRSQILSAIEGVEGKIVDLLKEIQELEKKRIDLTAEKSRILAKIAGEEKIKAELLAELQKINTVLAQLMKGLTAYQQKCEAIKVQIRSAEMELQKAQQALKTTVSRRITAEREVQKGEENVDALRKQLEAAERALATSKITLINIIEEEKRLPSVISGIEARLKSLQAELRNCEAEVYRINKEINLIRNNDITEQIKELQKSILAGRKAVLEIDAELAGLVQPLENLKAQLKGAQEDLQFLKVQIVKVEEELRQAYVMGNNVNTKVAHAKQNVDAANARYQAEDKVISEATLNLERARAEEALARLALEELIAHYSDALPYSIVPNGNGETPAGTPSGNNPSGSPLGPIKTDGNGAPGSFMITNWTHYLSSAFGAGVNPAFTGSVTRLYPFNFGSVVYDQKVVNTYGACGGNGPMRVGTGEVVEVSDESFKIRWSSGQTKEIEVMPCTKMNSNKQNYKMKKGDQVIIKGTEKSYKKMSASQVTCLRE